MSLSSRICVLASVAFVCCPWLSTSLLVAPISAHAEASPSRLGLNLSDCFIGEKKTAARCGTFGVYENRVTRTGRTIALPMLVLPARQPSNRAVFWNPGGPGASAVELGKVIADGVFAKELTELRRQYNVVFVDNRGTSGESEQQCDSAYPPAHPEHYFLQLWPDALLRACRERLAANADLSLYTSSIAADDLDDIRAALGYPKIVLDGVSYGTFFFLVYMRQHPEHVESAILDGVAPPGLLIVPLEDPAGAQLAMDHLVAACKADDECHKNFPAFGPHFAELSHRFDAGPLPIRILNPASGQAQDVLLSKEVFADRLRQTLYGAGPAAYVPYVVERAYQQDYVPLGQMLDSTTRGLLFVRVGANLSVTCAEDVPFATERLIKATSAESFEGDVRIRAQQHACNIWNVRPVPPSFNQPVRSKAPVLMVSGSDDPTSPAKFASAALQYLPNGKNAVVEGAAHATETECTDRLKVAFVLAGSARDLDAESCRAAFHRPPFATSMAGFDKE